MRIALVAAASSFGMLVAHPAGAAGENDGAALEQVVVTGTRVANRSALETAAPVDVVLGDQLQNLGITEINQALAASLPSFTFPRPGLSDGTDAVRPATLRGLSPDQTLVLVNSKRLHSAALVNVNGTIGRGASAPDLNTIPTAIVQSVEVLRDGASAQYGSDAIAGVVNLRLRQARDGGGTDLTYGWRDTNFDVLTAAPPANATWSAPGELSRSRSDGETLTASIWKGLPLTESGFLTVAAEYKDQEHTERGGWDHRPQYAFGQRRVRSARGDVQPLQLLVWRAGAAAEDAVRERRLRRFGQPRAVRLGELAGSPLSGRRVLPPSWRRAQHSVDLSGRLSAVDRRGRDGLLGGLRRALGPRRVADGFLARLRTQRDGVHDRSHAEPLHRSDQQDEVRCRRVRLRPAGR